MDRLHEVFRTIDVNNNGVISTHELSYAIRLFGLNPSEKEISNYQKEINKDSRGGISLKDFIDFMTDKIDKFDSPEDIVDAFRVFDMDENGFISTNELRHVLTNLGEKLNKQEMDDLIKVAHSDAKGEIDYRELVKRMSKEK